MHSPCEGGSVGRVIRVGDRESQQDVAVGLVLLHIHGVVALGKDGGVVIAVLDVDVEEDAGAERFAALVDCHHLKH